MTLLWPEYQRKLLKFCVDRSTVLGSSSDRSSGECGVMTTPRGRRSLLRRPVRGELSALAATPALRPERTRRGAKLVLACAVVTGALWSGAAAWADETPPAPTPTTTTPEAPPPDPYKAPAKPPPAKPKSTSRPTTPVTRSAPARTYTPPVQSRPSTPTYNAPTYTAPTYRAPTYRAPVTRAKTQRVAKKAVDKPRKRAVHRRTKPKPASVTVTLAPMAHVLAAAKVPLPVVSTSDGGRDPYLWLAGLAFALLAVAGLSLHLLSVRVFHLRFE
jgi:hypothetical protein